MHTSAACYCDDGGNVMRIRSQMQPRTLHTLHCKPPGAYLACMGQAHAERTVAHLPQGVQGGDPRQAHHDDAAGPGQVLHCEWQAEHTGAHNGGGVVKGAAFALIGAYIPGSDCMMDCFCMLMQCSVQTSQQRVLVAVLPAAWCWRQHKSWQVHDMVSRTRLDVQHTAPALSHPIELTCTTCRSSAPPPSVIVAHIRTKCTPLLTRSAGLSSPAGHGAPRHQSGAETPHQCDRKRSIARAAATFAIPARARFVRRFVASSRRPTHGPRAQTDPHQHDDESKASIQPYSAVAGRSAVILWPMAPHNLTVTNRRTSQICRCTSHRGPRVPWRSAHCVVTHAKACFEQPGLCTLDRRADTSHTDEMGSHDSRSTRYTTRMSCL